MRFIWDGDNLDALVLLDKSTIDEFTDECLYALDILLDPKGRSELVYDFPGEKWEFERD